MRKIIGWGLLASPFIGVAVFTTIFYGFGFTVGIFAGAAAICGTIALGVKLISD